MLRTAKRIALATMAGSGLSAVVARSSWRRRRLLVLCYHGVSLTDEHEWSPEMYVTPTRLRERLALLRDLRATILSLDEGIRRLRDGTLPPRAVSLTFDDGAADFRLRAVPVLQEFDAPATVYLTTYYVERTGLPVPNVMVPYLLWQARDRTAMDLSGHGTFASPIDLTTEGGRALATRGIVADQATLPTDEKDRRLDALAATLGLDMPAIRGRRHLQLMTPAEVRDLPRELVSVELHTHRHRTPDDEAAFRRELAENSAMIADLTGRAPRHFCYPSGRYRHAFLPWLRDMGVVSATTCVTGIATAHTEPLLTPRLVDTSHTPDTTFAGWVTGAAAMLPQRPATLVD